MNIRKISSYSEFLPLKRDWNNLLKESGHDSVFLRHEWFSLWWKSHGNLYEKNQNICILIIEDGDKPIGIIPLKTSRVKYRGLEVKKLGFIESELSPYVDFIIISDKEQCIRESLRFLRLHVLWDVLILNKFPVVSPNYRILESILSEQGIMYGINPSLDTPVVNTSGEWPDYLSQRSSKFRKSLRNKLNKAKKTADLQIEKFSEAHDIKDKLPRVFEISKRSWKAKIGQSIADSKEYTDFLGYIPDEMCNNGWVNLWLLKNSNEYIAYEYHLKYNGIVYPIAADFDERFRALSPGSILEYNIIKELFEDPEVKQYYTCAQDYKYLRNWTDLAEPHVDIEIFNSKPLGLALYVFEYRMLPFIRRTPLFQYVKNYLMKRDTSEKNT